MSSLAEALERVKSLKPEEKAKLDGMLREVKGFKFTGVDEHIKRFIEYDESLRRV